MKIYLALIFVLATVQVSAQDWWTKTKKESIPENLSSTNLLVERFKTKKLNDAPPSAFLDKEDQEEHPLIKETNNNLDKYNEDLRTIMKNYKFEYTLVSQTKSEDFEKYPAASFPYALKHEVYLRKYQKDGMTKHFYTYVFYFHDRVENNDLPYIYLFNEQRLKSLEELIGFLNTL